MTRTWHCRNNRRLTPRTRRCLPHDSVARRPLNHTLRLLNFKFMQLRHTNEQLLAGLQELLTQTGPAPSGDPPSPLQVRKEPPECGSGGAHLPPPSVLPYSKEIDY